MQTPRDAPARRAPLLEERGDSSDPGTQQGLLEIGHGVGTERPGHVPECDWQPAGRRVHKPTHGHRRCRRLPAQMGVSMSKWEGLQPLARQWCGDGCTAHSYQFRADAHRLVATANRWSDTEPCYKYHRPRRTPGSRHSTWHTLWSSRTPGQRPAAGTEGPIRVQTAP